MRKQQWRTASEAAVLRPRSGACQEAPGGAGGVMRGSGKPVPGATRVAKAGTWYLSAVCGSDLQCAAHKLGCASSMATVMDPAQGMPVWAMGAISAALPAPPPAQE